jgi:hypothetical protein
MSEHRFPDAPMIARLREAESRMALRSWSQQSTPEQQARAEQIRKMHPFPGEETDDD